MNPTSIHKDAGLIPGLVQCAKDSALPWACGVGHRNDSALALLWLWHRPTVTALILTPSLGTSMCRKCTPPPPKKKPKIYYQTLLLLSVKKNTKHYQWTQKVTLQDTQMQVNFLFRTLSWEIPSSYFLNIPALLVLH